MLNQTEYKTVDRMGPLTKSDRSIALDNEKHVQKANEESDNNNTRRRHKTHSPRSVRRVAMDCLARREHSFFELKKKLQTKLPDKNISEIEFELNRLRDENLQSDQRFVEAFVRYRKSKGFGYLHIKEQLRSRFVPESLIEEYLSSDEEHWDSLITRVIEKKLSGEYQLEFGGSRHRRIIRFLEGRGFQQSNIRKALARYL